MGIGPKSRPPGPIQTNHICTTSSSFVFKPVMRWSDGEACSRDKHMQADRQTSRQVGRRAGRQTNRQANRQEGKQEKKKRQTSKQRDTDRQADRPAGKHKGRQTCRQTDRRTDSLGPRRILPGLDVRVCTLTGWVWIVDLCGRVVARVVVHAQEVGSAWKHTRSLFVLHYHF